MNLERWTPRRARWFLIAVHIPFLVPSFAYTITGLSGPSGDPLPTALGIAAIGTIQLRHSFAAAQGERPRGWPWTLLALTVLVSLPLVWLHLNWASLQYCLVASLTMLLRGRAVVIAAVPALFTSVLAAVVTASDPAGHAVAIVYTFLAWSLSFVGATASLTGSALLVRVVDELHATRGDPAKAAVGGERLRLSRDLHDLLGQSLSAISLKGDLAARLLVADPAAARAEIESLAEVARRTLRDIRAVTRDAHAVSLDTELQGAKVLLRAAGVETRVTLDPPPPAPAAEAVLAWAAREGVANVLRHSEARTCSITATGTRLEIVNDGTRGPMGTGSGLKGLAERAAALSGAVSAGPIAGDRFRLLVEIPREPA
ncbi:sensor histidine kinase [Streptosporangium sp. CA-135522]|uniref:sensor histidine kinase n=1 Tax=Streptosporangium sp. CA-135522 TaxID=3240072 RepID=UPI003D94374D